MYIGIDLGGTNIAAGLVDDNGALINTIDCPTESSRKSEEIADDMIALCEKLSENNGYKMSDIKGIGIGCPGTVNNETGEILYVPNLGMDGFNLAGYIRNKINCPVHLANDADCAALGEYTANGNNAKSFILITLGTGVGGGVIINGKLYTGFNGMGAEIGHMTLVHEGELCGCGKKGCWEAYASVTALKRQTMDAMEKNPQSKICQIYKRDKKVSGRTAFDAAKQGDKVAREVVKQYAEYVASGLISVENIFQPEMIVIGGGISKEGDYLLNPIMEYVNKYRFNKHLRQTEINVAKLFNDAGIIGAAMLCK